ncbi:MAG: hypothetical protein IK015_01880 [Treponema sp.]|nr:hypothetical protein [Treponema sp.]
MEKAKTLAEIDKEIADVKKELADVHGTETEVYARIVGYYRAIRNWNKGKAEEFKLRKNFKLEDSSEYDIHSYGGDYENSQTTFSPESEMLMEDESIPQAQETANHNASQDHNAVVDLSQAQEARGLTYELFARKTCPNCPPVKEWIANSGLTGKTIDVDTEAGLAEAAQKGVFAAPTVIFYHDGTESARAHSVSELEEIINLETA